MTDLAPTTVSSAPESFGVRLQQAREAKRLSLKEVSDELFILERHLQALESESFDDLPQPAFTRGFVVNYAKFLGLDSVEVVQSFDNVYPSMDSLPNSLNNHSLHLRPMDKLPRGDYRRMRLNPLLIIAGISLVVLVVFLFRMMSDASKNPQPSSSVTDKLTASEQMQGAAINNRQYDYPDNGVGASGSALNLNNDSDMSNTSLELILTDTTTINIIDARGNSLITGNQARGNYQLTGLPPFKIDIDNIDNVNILLNQAPVLLSEYATDKQASFELAL